MKIRLFLLAVMLLSLEVFSQTPENNITGRVIDRDTKISIPGVNIVVQGSQPLLGTTTDVNGNFILSKLKVGRYNLKATCLGYNPADVNEVLVSSGKETFITLELSEQIITTKEVVISASQDKNKTVNEMAVISARSFTVDETRRYAGANDDPMRAVSNFAGVSGGSDINNNGIIIRGNSPKGLLWRVEGVDMPNPNHFGMIGQSGGGITLFSSQLLTNSDFYTAAFPAEYGNATSGVFDIHFRNGNINKNEFTVQAGLLGLDLSAEGPLKKGSGSSFLFNYRYSLLALVSLLNKEMKNDIPSYQDLSFKININTKKAGVFSVFGIGGTDKSGACPKKDSSVWKTTEDLQSTVFKTKVLAVGISNTFLLSKRTFIKNTLSGTTNIINGNNGLIGNDYNIINHDEYSYQNYRVSLVSTLNHKFGKKHFNKTGIIINSIFLRSNIKTQNPLNGILTQIVDVNCNNYLLQFFSESKIEFSEKLNINAGFHLLYFSANNSFSPEPRVAIKWNMTPGHSLSLGYGLHSQIEDASIYQFKDSLGEPANNHLTPCKAHHIVLSYDYLIRKNLNFRTEIYYQILFDVPVIRNDYYSTINTSGGYTSYPLVNTGKGRNYGVDLTLERYFDRRFYFLITASFFESKYKGGDGIERNTRYNSNYVGNLLIGKEFIIKHKNILGLNMKFTYTGGEYYIPVDLSASVEQNNEVLDLSQIYTKKLTDITYLDFTFTYRTNYRKFSGVFAVQLKNLLNQKAIIGYAYNPYTHNIDAQKNWGILPNISYKFEF